MSCKHVLPAADMDCDVPVAVVALAPTAHPRAPMTRSCEVCLAAGPGICSGVGCPSGAIGCSGAGCAISAPDCAGGTSSETGGWDVSVVASCMQPDAASHAAMSPRE